MHTRFKSLLTASVLAAGLSIVLPLQAQPVDKTGRFPAPRAQSAPVSNPTAQHDDMGGMTAAQMREMMENCNRMMGAAVERHDLQSGLYMDLERNQNERPLHTDLEPRRRGSASR